MVFRPPRSLGVIVGAGFTAWALGMCALAVNLAWGIDPQFKTFVAWALAAGMGVVGLVFANWTHSIATMAYVVDDDALIIKWGWRRVVVPINTIQRMLPGRTLDEPSIRGLNWWGCHVGSADVKRLGFTLFYSTHNAPEELLYVVTTDESYGLTVLDQAAFAEEIQGRAQIGSVETHTQRSAATGLAAFPFWRDRVALTLMATSAVLCAVVCGYVYARYPSLPDIVTLSFPDLEGVVRVGEKSALLRIAWLGAGVLVANTVVGIAVHAKERAAGLWLMASGAMLQVVLLAAAVAAFAGA